jgi:DNA-binding IclR family transcriptional regulator
MNASRAGGAQAVVRALRLLKQFHAAPELAASELTARSGLNRTTVVRLLAALQSEGLLERDPSRKLWRLGPQVAALGRLAGGDGRLAELAQPELDALAGELSETVTLEVRRGDAVGIVAEALGHRVLGALPSLGTSWPAHATSTGKVLCAALSATERDRILAGRRRKLTPRTLSTRASLVTEFDRVARLGFATNWEELELGYVAVAVPVRDLSGRVIAALSAGGPIQRLDRGRLRAWVEPLTAASLRITRRLGG